MDSRPSKCSMILNLRVEPMIMIAMIVTATSSVAMQMLMQDKLCISKHALDHNYCSHISEMDESPEKDRVLADVAFYSSLKEYITVVPRVIIVLFTGSWCDRFPAGRRYVMLASMLGFLLDSLLLLMNSRFFEWDYRFIILCTVPSSLLACGLSMTVSSYIIATTEEKHRSIRFLLMDVFVRTGIVVGFLSSGWILPSKPLFLSESGTSNHSEIFLLNTFLASVCLLWVYFRINVIAEHGTPTTEEEDNNNTPLFAWKDVKDVASTLTRSRPSNNRRNMWLLLYVYSSVHAPWVGLMYIYYPLCELLYKWDIQTYGFMVGTFEAVTPITLACFTGIVVRRMKPRPTTLIMIGLTSSILGYVCMGSITTVHGFYLNSIAASLTNAATSGVRSFLSLIIPADEITKVYSLMQLLETVLTFVSPAIASLIFKATISTIPTIVFHCFAALLLISLVIVATIDLSVRKESRKKETGEEETVEA